MKKIIFMSLCLAASAQSNLWGSLSNFATDVGGKAFDFGKNAYNSATRVVAPALSTNGCGEGQVRAFFIDASGRQVEMTSDDYTSIPFHGKGLNCDSKSEDSNNYRRFYTNLMKENGATSGKIEINYQNDIKTIDLF